MKKFNEPSWNNPVVRIIDDNDKNVIPRINGAYTLDKVVDGIISALIERGVQVPTYLDLLLEEAQSRSRKIEYFSMYCFWSGEGKLGNIAGVLETKAGWMDGKEVVEVSY